MLDRFLAALALAVLVGFLAILVIFVPRADLGMVVILTIAVAFYDMALHRSPPS